MRRWARADALVLALVAGAVLALGFTAGAGSRPAGTDTGLTIGAAPAGRAIPAGFLGLSIEYPAIEQYAGNDPSALNPRFIALVRDIAGPAPVVRIGGDSTDWTWWPVAGAPRPPGVTYTLTPRWLAVTGALTRRLNARLLLGVNFEADDVTVAGAEANALLGAFSRGAIQALELGNEPELYGAFPWYRTASGHRVTGRPPSYHFAAFDRDFTRIAGALPATVPLAGPTASGPGYMRHVAAFLADQPRVAVVTLHRYPLQLCFASQHPSVAQLLSNKSSRNLAQFFARAAVTAHRSGRTLRVDELNTVSCGADPAVSRSFGSALWAVDALFEMNRAGVDGVNIHTFPGAGYDLFGVTRAGGQWTPTVAPEYYGLRLFAQAAPAGSVPLPVTGAGEGAFKAWAVRAAGGQTRVVLINKAARGRRVVSVRVPGARGAASLERLVAPGRLVGAGRVSLRGGRYAVTVPALSAALLVAGAGNPPDTESPG